MKKNAYFYTPSIYTRSDANMKVYNELLINNHYMKL